MPDCLREIRSLLVWTVLTASTIGPGTIAMCSKAGADYKGVLIWCVLIAALIAWVMQEGTARLTIASGRSLGDYIREQTQTSRRLMLARCFFAAFVVVGNFAYECNNFAGTMASVELLIMPSTPLNLSAIDCNSTGGRFDDASADALREVPPGALASRQAINAALGPLCMLLLLGGTRRISLLLSGVVALMVTCYASTLVGSGVRADVLAGLVPSIPDGSSELVLALIGTTAIPVNLLMGSSIARSSSPSSMRRGVGLASCLSGVLSFLVLLVGSLVPPRPSCVPFALSDVAHVLEHALGRTGLVGFAVGLFGAGISSALTIPLGTTLAIEDMFALHSSSASPADAAGTPTQKSLASADAAAVERASRPGSPHSSPQPAAHHSSHHSSPRTAMRPIRMRPPASTNGLGRWRRLGRWRTACGWQAWGKSLFLAVFLGLSLIPSLLRLPTIAIIMTAQVVNGVLLPCVAALLLIGLNDATLMGAARPQSAHANLLMFPCVAVALYLASVVLLKQTVGRALGSDAAHVAILAAFPVALLSMLALGGCVWIVRDGGAAHRRRRTSRPPVVRTVEVTSVAALPPC